MQMCSSRWLYLVLLTAILGLLGCPKPKTAPAPDLPRPSESSEVEAQREQSDSESTSRATSTGESESPSASENNESSGGTTGAIAGSDQLSSGPGEAADVPGRDERRSGQSSNSPRSTTGPTSEGDPAYRPPSDPQSAQAAAEKALAAAEKAARADDYGTAYRQALAGWQQANTYSKQDAKCRGLAQTLLGRLEEYGERANQAAGVTGTPPPSHKKLILK